LHEAAQMGVLAEAPWLLAPAGAIVISVLSLYLVSATKPAGLSQHESLNPL
jgi:ABC-type dipeptide/oligopeptide/nickel transport system permease subunit